MPHKLELKYRTFQQLLDTVRGSMPKQDINGFIDENELIPIAQNINKELTVSINQTKEDVFTIENYKVMLPDDFYLLDFTLACSNHEITYDKMDEYVVHAESRCVCSCTEQSETDLEITKKCGSRTIKWKTNRIIKMTDPQFVRTDCPNRKCNSDITAYIKQGYLWLNIESGHVYLHYTSTMESESGELMVLDHDIINQYYEYALKKRILENMLYRGEDVVGLLKYTAEELRKATIKAKSIVAMPDFNRLVDFFRKERERTWQKYYKPFGL